jgi:hypothetical protein
MLSFFHGGRRKMGVSTLVMACALMVGWCRSFHTNDQPTLSVKGYDLSLDSDRGRLTFIYMPRRTPWAQWVISWNTTDVCLLQAMELELERLKGSGSAPTSIWQRLGFDRTVPIPIEGLAPHWTWAVPYWSVTIPLTMLSTYRLLSKPRRNPNHSDDTSQVPPLR